MITEICGITPEEIVLLWKILPNPERAATPSSTLAPPESCSPTIGAPIFSAMFLHFDDLFCVIFTQRSTAYREVLRKCEYQSSVYLAVACNNAVTRQFFFVHAEVRASVFYEHIDLNKAVFVKKDVQPFSR